MAPALVGDDGETLKGTMLPTGRVFYKMSGSGNDFVVVDAMTSPADGLMLPPAVQALCARGTGIGADGLVLLEPSGIADYRMTYLNSDGSRADLCGNASLCSARLASELGLFQGRSFRIETDAGILNARLLDDGPEIDLQPVVDVRRNLPFRLAPGERAIGYALAGVPHLVVRVDDSATVDVGERGRSLRNDPSLEHGANVNFVSCDAGGAWRVRTFERGVEGETLACGTGAVATAILLAEAGEINEVVSLITRAGRALRVRLARDGAGWLPSLSGEARIVFQGQFGEI